MGYFFAEIKSRIPAIGERMTRAEAFDKAWRLGFKGDFFFNCCIEVSTILEVENVLKEILNIEKEMGRRNRLSNKYESRIIDIDIIFFGDQIVNKKKLVIPHPRYCIRDFVLIPLLEINGKLKDPETGILVSDFLLKIKKNQSIKKMEF